MKNRRTVNLHTLEDHELDHCYDNALVDHRLAHRYAENAHLREPIEDFLDKLTQEYERRGIKPRFPKPSRLTTSEGAR